jgi:hypothetical protein
MCESLSGCSCPSLFGESNHADRGRVTVQCCGPDVQDEPSLASMMIIFSQQREPLGIQNEQLGWENGRVQFR